MSVTNLNLNNINKFLSRITTVPSLVDSSTAMLQSIKTFAEDKNPDFKDDVSTITLRSFLENISKWETGDHVYESFEDLKEDTMEVLIRIVRILPSFNRVCRDSIDLIDVVKEFQPDRPTVAVVEESPKTVTKQLHNKRGRKRKSSVTRASSSKIPRASTSDSNRPSRAQKHVPDQVEKESPVRDIQDPTDPSKCTRKPTMQVEKADDTERIKADKPIVEEVPGEKKTRKRKQPLNSQQEKKRKTRTDDDRAVQYRIEPSSLNTRRRSARIAKRRRLLPVNEDA
ncbi:hypothetical protein ACOME3_003275 [Neoechinorhynchus agilis]